MRNGLILAAVALLACACGDSRSTSAQAAMAPGARHAAWVEDAIAGKPAPPVKLATEFGALIAVFTPYERVAAAAEEARAQYKPFTVADVTTEMATEIHVYAPNIQSNVVAVVIAPRGSIDPAQVIRPIRTEVAPSPGVVAVFPAAAFVAQNDIRVVYDAPNILCTRSGPAKGTAECVVPIS